MRLFVKLIIGLILFINYSNCEVVEQLKGSIWPQPQEFFTSDETSSINIEEFRFIPHHHSHTCDILFEAFIRYEKLIKSIINVKNSNSSSLSGHISSVKVHLASKCEELPGEKMQESYTLDIGFRSGLIYSESIWGVLRGLETFSQLLWKDTTGKVMVNISSIVDFPRFTYRGVLIDTSRHYLPVKTILRTLEIMAYSKFNVLHWHIVDSPSFPFVSQLFPELHLKGAYNPSTHIYTPADVKKIIEFARMRGIRVIPEFDSPGHTESWGKSKPELLTSCYSDGKPNGKFGPIDPTNPDVYKFIKSFWGEINKVFPDNYLHLGGDEVDFTCWKSNPKITEFMKTHNISSYSKLEELYIQKVIDINEHYKLNYIVWQEVIDNGVKANNQTVVEVWKGPVQLEMARITKMGYKVIVTQPWYLNLISYGQDWQRYYSYEPLNFQGTDQQKQLVLGGEACMWGEYVDSTNIESRLWPRALAVAERLWSSVDVNDVKKAYPRLHSERCKLLTRGIRAEPVFTGFCEDEWNDL